MGDLTKNFSRSEFACKCGCGQDTIDWMVVEWCQAIRDHFDAPLTIISGNRCPKYNLKVGGALLSQHLRGRAADIGVAGVLPSVVADFASGLVADNGGIGRYPSFTHLDSRGSRARWRE